MKVDDKVIAEGMETRIIGIAYDDNGTEVYMVEGSMKDYYEKELKSITAK
jgi:hypothetical protein